MGTAGLRSVLAASLGGIGLAFTIGTAALLHAEAGDRLQRLIGDQLHQHALQVADKLDRGMFERYRDLMVAASLESIRSHDATRDSRRAVLQRLQDTYRDYAWIGFITPGGILEAATGRVLEGADVNKRDWWKHALERPYVGDVHDALVLARLLYADRKEPPRFVDLAAPVRAADGGVTGVVAAHLSWDWATEVERSVLGRIDPARRVEAMILAADGTVILGPPHLVGQHLDDALARPSAGAIRTWPGDTDYLTSAATTRGYRDYPGLGWTVVLREPARLALAPVRDLRDRVIAWGVGGSLLAVLLGYLLAGWIAAPLRSMARAVTAAGPADRAPALPRSGRYAEIDTLSDAVRGYLEEIRAGERRLKASLDEKTVLVNEVHHRVKNNLQVIYGLMIVEMRQLPKGDHGRQRIEALSRRITAMGRLHEQLYLSDDLARIDFGEHLRQLGGALWDLRPHNGVSLRVEAAPTACSLEVASPLGLIANELVTNALRHAFPNGRPGTVTITLDDDPDRLLLRVADDGIGCGGTSGGAAPAGGIGMALIAGLVRQIGGTLSFEAGAGGAGSGCVATVTIPKHPHAVREEFRPAANQPVAA